MRRRKKGTGTIVKKGDTYYGRIIRHGNVKVVKLSKNQRESDVLWREWLKNNFDQFVTDAVKHPIDEAWPTIQIALKASAKSDRAIQNARLFFEKIRDWMIAHGTRNIEEIQRRDIIDLLDEKCKGMSSRTKREYVYGVRLLFTCVCPDSQDPTRGIKIRATKTLAREPFSEEEVRLVLDKAESRGHSWKVLIEVALYTGLRLVDCVYLKKEEVKDGVLNVTPRKTAAHDIKVRSFLNPILKKELDTLTPDNNGFFFPDIIELYKARRLEMRLRHIFNVVGETRKNVDGRKRAIPIKGFHALRATFITRLAEQGVPLAIIESISGHIDPRQTLHYTHPDDDSKKAAISALGFNGHKGEKFVTPELQRITAICAQQVSVAIEKALGKKVEVELPIKWREAGSPKWRKLSDLTKRLKEAVASRSGIHADDDAISFAEVANTRDE